MVINRQRQLIGAIAETLRKDSRSEPAWLAGSRGKEAGDAFSDIDVLVVVLQAYLESALRYAAQ